MLTPKDLAIEEQLGFDPDDLLAKYRAERDKRMRPDALGQFVALNGEFEHFQQDPYAAPEFTRAPLTDAVDVIVIGGGFGGLLVGAQLRKAGVASIRIIDRAGDFGGTWYWNRYPGAACDTESYIYLPLLEELGYMPQRKYAKAPEIQAHCRRIAEHFDLYRDTCFQTEVTGMAWDEAASRWVISTNRNDAMRARFVVVAPGLLDRPKLAGIPGIESFQGHAFHTSRWDYSYTGGNSEGGLTGLGDKVVGIIGTGATAIQCIPHLAQGAKHLYVFQRTPSSIDFRDDRPTDPAWVASLEPGWQQKRLENFTTLTSGGYAEENLTNDGWTGVARNVQQLVERRKANGASNADLGTLTQVGNYMKMEELRARVDAVIADRATAEALKPWYNHFCKRPCFHDDYLPAFNRPNVTLVDTDGKGVDRITERGLIVAGKAYDIDCLVYSTGFEVGTDFTRRLGFEISGRNGLRLSQKWAHGAATLHGLQSHGFPNLFLMTHIQSAAALNFPHMLGEQARHIAYIIERAFRADARVVEVTPEAEAAWVAEIDRMAVQREAFDRECTPGYLNFEGDLTRRNVRNSSYGAGPMALFETLKGWRADGTLRGLTLT